MLCIFKRYLMYRCLCTSISIYPSTYVCIPGICPQLCPTLFDPRGCGPPGSSVYGILQARILEWVAFLSSGIFPTWQLIEPTSACISCIAGGFFTHWATWEAHGRLYHTAYSYSEYVSTLCLGLENLAGRDGTSGNSRQGWLPALEWDCFWPWSVRKGKTFPVTAKRLG